MVSTKNGFLAWCENMKSTKETIRLRLEEILEIRLLGAEWSDIVRHSAEKGWGVGERQLLNYVHRTDDLLEKTLEQDRRKLINRHIAQRRALYARCMAVSDYSNARSVLKDEAELLGLYPGKGDEPPQSPPPPEPEWTDGERGRRLWPDCLLASAGRARQLHSTTTRATFPRT